MKGDDKLVKSVNDAIAKGRATVIEMMLLEGLVTSLTNHGGAVTSLNTDIQSLSEASLTQSDINATLWRFVSLVLKGQKRV